MGQRAGYRLIAAEKESPIYRTQWTFGDDPAAWRGIIRRFAMVCCGWNPLSPKDPVREIGSGMTALREGDFGYGRAWPNFIFTLRSMGSEFNSVEDDTNCDISDSGLYTLRIVSPYEWVWEHQDIHFDTSEAGDVKKLLKVTLVAGKRPILDDAFQFEELSDLHEYCVDRGMVDGDPSEL